jgi:hypothetical protein
MADRTIPVSKSNQVYFSSNYSASGSLVTAQTCWHWPGVVRIETTARGSLDLGVLPLTIT